MITPPEQPRQPTHVLLVGGGSRSAQPFRRLAAMSETIELRTLMRTPTPAFQNETVVQVADYFAPPEPELRWADTVINFAGISASRDKGLLSQVNVKGPMHLAARSKALGVGQLLHISSLHVYGYAEDIHNGTPENPLTAYARSKLAADIALARLADPPFCVTLLRPPIHYGGGSGHNLIRLANMMTRLGWFPVSTKPAQRSTVHIENLASSLMYLAQTRLGGIRFVTDEEPFTIEIFAEVIRAVTQRDIRLLKLPRQTFLPLKWAANDIHSRLYRTNLVRPEDRLVGPSYPKSLRDGLTDLFRKPETNHDRK